ncbi:MAG: heparinase II/III family protein [Acidimicrobiia bacterium]
MSRNFLTEPLRDAAPDHVLAHFQNRNAIRTFALRDDEQAGPAHTADVLANRFTFNGETHQLAPGFDWTRNPSPDREWSILLHKFYFAVGLGEDYQRTGDHRYAEKWVELTAAWIDTVDLEFLPPDVTARRVQNWIYAHHHFVAHPDPADLDPGFYVAFLESLHSQVDYLRHHLATKRNHRTMQLQAIFMAAVVFPEMEGAAAWLEFSIDELAANLRDDFLPDGVHCEMSSDYHLLVVRNFLGIVELARLNGIDLPEEMTGLLRKALEFGLWIHKPDGDIPALSDGDSRSFRSVLDQGHRLFGDRELRHGATAGVGGVAPDRHARLFADSGYVVMRSGWGETEPYEDERYLVFDCGPLGEGNHGHLDLLSFEAAAHGRSVVVDPGRYTYHEPPPGSGQTNWRARFRGTGYHNTVLVDGRDQTRYVFHKTRHKIRGEAPGHELRRFVTTPGFDFVHGIARSNEYDVAHERKIFFMRPEYWLVVDILRAADRHAYDLLFHLSDEAQGRAEVSMSGTTATIDAPGLVLAHEAAADTSVSLEPGFVSRTYGTKHAAPIARMSRTGGNIFFATAVYPFRSERPALQVESLDVRCESAAGLETGATAIRVVIDNSSGRVEDTFFNAEVPGSYKVGEFVCGGSLFVARRRAGEVDVHCAAGTVASMVGVAA